MRTDLAAFDLLVQVIACGGLRECASRAVQVAATSVGVAPSRLKQARVLCRSPRYAQVVSS